MYAQIYKLTKLRFVVTVFIVGIVLYYLLVSNTKRDSPIIKIEEIITDRDIIKQIIDKRIQESLKYDKGAGCVMPKYDPFDEAIMKYVQNRSRIVCGGFDWVRCNLSKCSVRPEILKQYPNVTCKYQDVIFIKDGYNQLGPKTLTTGDGVYELVQSDHAKVHCEASSSDELLKSYWFNYVIGVRKNVKIKNVNNDKSYNVMVVAFDSTATNAFIRLMPKSYRTLLDHMGAVLLNGYNIVGEGTPAAIFPILIGKNELELPDRRKGFSDKSLDDLPFIFYKLKDHGYRTAYFEDMLFRWGGTFNYRFTGFTKQPTDHYMRSFLYAYNSRRWKNMRKFCIGDTPVFQVLLNTSEQLYRVDRKKFVFTFIGDISHEDINKITSADEALTRFLKNFKAAGHMEDTMLIVMGDHGTRYGGVRYTFLGKIEERHPLMAIMLPEKLKKDRPNAVAALKENVNVLTTPHDLHATLLDVVDLRQYWNPMKIPGADMKRGLTLLEPISKNRSCSEAGIESHWCTCLKWDNVTSEDKMYQKSALALVNYINNLTTTQRSICVKRTLAAVHSVERYGVRKELLWYTTQIGKEGYLSVMNSNTPVEKQTYFVKIAVDPGQGIYEATMEYYKSKKEFVINVGSISRINPYGDEPSCIRLKFPHLNMFCYCKEYLRKKL